MHTVEETGMGFSAEINIHHQSDLRRFTSLSAEAEEAPAEGEQTQGQGEG